MDAPDEQQSTAHRIVCWHLKITDSESLNVVHDQCAGHGTEDWSTGREMVCPDS